MERAFVRLEGQGPILTLLVDRPDKLNALDARVVAELGDAIAEASARPGVRCLIVAGAGDKAFVAGADIAEMRAMRASEARAFARAGHDAFDAPERLPFPAIAAVQGFALGGGCELALACDFVYASEKAKLGQPEVKLGVIPGFGGTQRLARRVGIAMARELVYTGRTIDAAEALRIGLVQEVVPAAELLDRATALAGRVAAQAPLGVLATLASARHAMHEGEAAEAGRLLERTRAILGSEDAAEGVRSFLERREAVFKGR